MNICILTHGRGKFTKGTTYSTRRLYEAAKARGHNVRVINAALCYVQVDSAHPHVMYEGESLDDFEVVIPRIMPQLTSYASAIVRQFEMMGAYTTARSIAIVRSRDKFRSLQLLARQGVKIPKTIFSRETAELDNLIERIGTPMIIKIARGTQGRGVVLAETKKAAKSVIQAFYVSQVNILLQEYVQEAVGTDIRAFVVGNRVVASILRQSLDDDFRSNLHQGGTGIPVKLSDEERRTAIKAAQTMGLPVCGVDMIRSDHGTLVLEVNSSPSLEGVEKVTGRDVADKIVEYIELNAKRRNKRDRVGA